MKTIKLVVLAILAMVFAFPAIAADQPKQAKPQVQRVAVQSQKSQQDFNRQYSKGLARSCVSTDCRKPAKPLPPIDVFGVLGK